MMLDYLLYASCGLIIVAFLGYILLVLINRKNKITESDGFNITKDVLNEYNAINIIENKNAITVYNIKRGVIKIASKCYYGNTVSDIAIPLIEAGVSVADNNNNKFISLLKKVMTNLKKLYVFPIVAIIINFIGAGTTDAKIGIFLLIVFIICEYMLIGIKGESVSWLGKRIDDNKNINKENELKIINFINKVILFDKLIFIGELIMVIRYVAILLEFS